MKKIFLTIGLVLFIAVFACTPAVASDEETVVFARPEGFVALDPQNNHHLSNMIVDKLIYDRLIEITSKAELVPGLAERWETSDDGTSVKFYLRKGIKFHNGEPFNSASVKFTLERLRDNPELLRSRNLGRDQIDKVEIIDDNTVVLYLKKPYGPLFMVLAQYYSMLPPKAYADQKDELWKNPIGTGPFKFVEYVRDVRYVVEANRSYWQKGIPKVDRIVYKPIKEPSTLIASILTGDIDIVDMVHPDQAPALKLDKKIKILRGTAWDGWFYQFNMKHPILKDLRVREAIDLATDREGLVEVMGGGAPRWIWSLPGMVGYTDKLSCKYDPEGARKLLKETGYTKKELAFSYKVPEGWYPKMDEVAVTIQHMMSEVGITFDVRVMEGASFMDARHSADYDIFTTGAAFIDPSSVTLPRIVHDQDHSSYKNEKLNQLVIDAANTLDQAKRQRLYEEVYKIMFKEKAPQLPFFQMETIYAHRDNITGFPFSPFKVADMREVDTTGKPGPVN